MGTVHGTLALRRKAHGQDGGDLGSDVYRHVFQSQRAARRWRSRSTDIHCNRRRSRFHSRGGGYLRMDMAQEPQGSGDCLLRSASGRIRSFVTVRDFSPLMSCYAELEGRIRTEAGVPAPPSSRWPTSSVSASGAGRADRPPAAIARRPARCERRGCVRPCPNGPPCARSRRRGRCGLATCLRDR